jgi:hypothetical protein
MSPTLTLSPTRNPRTRRLSYAQRVVVTVVSCVAGAVLLGAAQIPLCDVQTGILDSQASGTVGYLGSAPVVAQADLDLLRRLRSRGPSVEPLPAR